MAAQTEWPLENVDKQAIRQFRWHGGAWNRVLDFHGDPCSPDLTIVSDGNHHMALEQALDSFAQSRADTPKIFYLTLPPYVLSSILDQGGVHLGNLVLAVRPDLIIGPRAFVEKHTPQFGLEPMQYLATSRGNSFLVHRGNPMKLHTLRDVIESGARFFISHPQREKASYEVYRQTLENFAVRESIPEQKFRHWFDTGAQWFRVGQRVHHREAPEALLAGEADVTLLYHHLALRFSDIFSGALEHVALYGAGTASPAPEHVITDYYLAAAAQAKPLVQDCVEFMLGPQTAGIYQRFGLGRKE